MTISADETKREYWNRLLEGLEQGCLPERDCWEEEQEYWTVCGTATPKLGEKTSRKAFFSAAAITARSVWTPERKKWVS